LSRMAETEPVVAGAVVVSVVLAVQRRWRDMVVVPLGLALELAVFITVNEVVRRPRPEVVKLGSEPTTYSFPSGHIAAPFVLWAGIVWLFVPRTAPALVRRARWLLPVSMAFLVGWSRVYRGMHHLIDVGAGALVGVGVFVVALVAARASVLAAGAGVDPERDE